MPEWVTVAIKGRVEALLIQGLLDSAGLPVHLRGEALGEIYGFNTGPLGSIEVQVPAAFVAQARGILAARLPEENKR